MAEVMNGCVRRSPMKGGWWQGHMFVFVCVWAPALLHAVGGARGSTPCAQCERYDWCSGEVRGKQEA